MLCLGMTFDPQYDVIQGFLLGLGVYYTAFAIRAMYLAFQIPGDEA